MKAVKQFKFTNEDVANILLTHIQISGHPEIKPGTLEVEMRVDGDQVSIRGVEGSRCLITLEVPLR